MKKLINPSNILACVSFVFALVMVILYAVNINTNGYFQGVKAQYVVLMCILTMVAACGIIGLNFLKFDGVAGKCVTIGNVALKVAIPVFMFIAALMLVQSRIEGFGYIFFSNVDVAKEVATPANISSAITSMVAIGFGAVAALVGIVAAFFQPKKEEPEPQQD